MRLRSPLYGERRNPINQFPLQPQQIGCRLRCNGTKANGPVSGVHVLDRLQLPTGWILLSEHFTGCCVNFVEVLSGTRFQGTATFHVSFISTQLIRKEKRVYFVP
jgi:hypothetical protein